MSKINKLFRYFWKIEPKKHKDITLWLSSSYQNPDEDTLALWKYLIQSPPPSQDKAVDKMDFFAKVFPNQPYHDAKLRNSMSNLVKQWTLYWKYQWVINHPIGDMEFANYLTYDNQYLEDATPILAEVEKKLINEKKYEVDYYYNWYLLRKTQIYTQSLTSKKAIDYILLRLKQSIVTLDEFYFTAQLKHHLLFVVNSRTIALEDKDFIIKTTDLLGFLSKQVSVLAQNALLNMYYLLLNAYFFHSESDLDSILALYNEEVFTSFSVNDKMQIMALIPVLIRHVNPTNTDKKILDFLLKEIALKITFDRGSKGYIRASRFYVIIRMGIDIYGVEWVKDFVEKNKVDIDPQYKEITLLLAKCLIDLYLGNYRKASKWIHSFIGNDNFLLNINFHVLRLMVSYKMVEKEGEDVIHELQNAIRSLQSFLKSDNTLSSKAKANYLSFAKILIKLAKTPYEQKSQLEKLKNSCIDQKITEKDWLLREIESKLKEQYIV